MKRQNQSNTIFRAATLIILILLSLFLLTACAGQSAPTPSQPQDQPNSSQLTETASAQSESISAPENDEAIIVMERLSRTAYEYLHSGWLHLIQQAASDTDQNQNNERQDDSVFIVESQTECWLELDEDLVIQRSVCLLTDPDGSVIQVGVRTVGESWIIHNGVTTAQDRVKTSYTPEIDALADKAAKDNPDLRVKEFPPEVTGDAIQLSYTVDLSSPVEIEDYDLPITKREHIYTFDQQTGMMLLYQEWVFFEEGAPRNAGQTKYLVIEFVDAPPEDILQYFVRE